MHIDVGFDFAALPQAGEKFENVGHPDALLYGSVPSCCTAPMCWHGADGLPGGFAMRRTGSNSTEWDAGRSTYLERFQSLCVAFSQRAPYRLLIFVIQHVACHLCNGVLESKSYMVHRAMAQYSNR